MNWELYPTCLWLLLCTFLHSLGSYFGPLWTLIIFHSFFASNSLKSCTQPHLHLHYFFIKIFYMFSICVGGEIWTWSLSQQRVFNAHSLHPHLTWANISNTFRKWCDRLNIIGNYAFVFFIDNVISLAFISLYFMIRC